MKILPFCTASWALGLVKQHDLPHFDIAYGNPPFGRVSRGPDEKARAGTGRPYKGPRYRGPEFEFNLIDIASDYADHGVFILPQMSSPFQFSGARYYRRDRQTKAYQRFEKETGLYGDAAIGIDTTVFKDDWQNITPPPLEFVSFDFEAAREARKPAPIRMQPSANQSHQMQQMNLFAA